MEHKGIQNLTASNFSKEIPGINFKTRPKTDQGTDVKNNPVFEMIKNKGGLKAKTDNQTDIKNNTDR